MSYKFNDQLWLMDEAIIEANKAYKNDEVPIGAIVVDNNGNIISRSHNDKESSFNPCGHAEILAIVEAAKKISSWRLLNCSIFVTLEPCPMCLAAIREARIKTLYFGAYDAKGGSISLGYNLHKDVRLNHAFDVVGGLKHFECSRLLSQFFKEKRSNYNNG
jgi:tRNA(adenine34) deaminase